MPTFTASPGPSPTSTPASFATIFANAYERGGGSPEVLSREIRERSNRGEDVHALKEAYREQYGNPCIEVPDIGVVCAH